MEKGKCSNRKAEVMQKIRFYFDKDKEEKWLNDMCQSSWAMTKFFMGIYTFKPCQPGEYMYRIDMPAEIGKGKLREKREQYIELVEETGAEHVCDWFWWSIFRKEASKGAFELYTDCESQLALYKRIRKLFVWVGCFEVFLTANNTLLFIKDAGDKVDVALLCIMYLIVMVFIVGIVKTTWKIKKIKQQIIS